MDKSIYGKYDVLKEVQKIDFSYDSNRLFNYEIEQGNINIYKYSFKKHIYYDGESYKAEHIMPSRENTSFKTKELYWQAYVFFDLAKQDLHKFDCRESILHAFNRDVDWRQIKCNNSVKCGGYNFFSQRDLHYNDIIQNISSQYRYYWYFPHMTNEHDDDIRYCYLFELTDIGSERLEKARFIKIPNMFKLI